MGILKFLRAYQIPSEGMTVPAIVLLAVPVIIIFSPLMMSGTYEEKY
jgi:hypothetical protein